jgi:hypothetical protein
MSQWTPSNFWNRLKGEIRLRGNWSAYQKKTWTPIVVSCAKTVFQQLNLAFDHHLGLDLCGYESDPKLKNEWYVRIAFEAENAADWKYELCKLAHVVADLRVLVAYQLHVGWKAEDSLQGYISSLRQRLIRVPDARWLLVFGPGKPDECWTAYTLTNECEIQSVDEAPLLCGCEMGIL